ncbi:8-amino-7-oxononanoate synthase [Candidatus Woesearchaeota archaeon CG_4_10_14_0_2_um_filter_33_10]|nr:MAG: 8-amino-7-oxononanoate synthase [Candidatus Woesearchaeota archaeon CG_4_10_14_0_2_um_filter_33_10]
MSSPLEDNNPLREKIEPFIQRIKQAKEKELYFYLQSIEGPSGPRIRVDGKEKINLSSYNYPSIVNHPKIIKAAIKAIKEYGAGTAGVRLLAGTSPIHKELEAKIAEFKGAEDAVTYSSGYVTNLTVVSTLCGIADLVIMDKLDHASIIDGCMLSGADHKTYLHNNMESLEKILADSKKKYEGKFKLVIVDAVYSMDGDIANLPEISRLAKKYDAYLMVDEAHSIGHIGKTGHGIEEHFNMKGAVDIHMGTLSKAIPSIGGYIAGDKDLITYLKHGSRAFIFSASIPQVNIAIAKASLEVIESEPWRMTRLHNRAEQFRKGLKKIGYDIGYSNTALIPIMIRDEEKTLKLARLINDRGLFIMPIIFPAVPKNTDRLRTHVQAGHTKKDISNALDILKESGKELGILK